MSQKSPIRKRIARLFKLLIWLYHTGRNLHQLDHATAEQRAATLRHMGQSCLDTLGIQIHVEPSSSQPSQPKQSEHGLLIAANHVSWLDIFVITALYPSSFIAMQELKNWPIIGKMVTNAGTVYIDRSNRKDINIINAAISRVLDANGNVCFFPEARTTLGNGMLPLKAALFQAALDSNAPVQPIAMRYYNANERTTAVSFANANLFQSLWRIVSIEQINVKVTVAPQLLPCDLPERDRFLLKDQVEQTLLPIVLSDSPHPEQVMP
ncbi:1-acylglycerol-3-phosphate O-acyltransferase [Kingella sp. (in: b-proteobacteria)]|uniref:1-acylglycerol-3-phosphate O-acyltransferase n=1 Tax=Kingella sp. (in: b-proteobacteria) TaxID=2020713 RepID=UPI0026DAB2BD|nr:1-acylglycerol-3-phosphate O-acyltransferase [Kingella sp. (in: b-proteobacteria)]MDO4656419.1 1-acylglycerol-3-phosphate O-acyltransferase [Kingella sp. (in: b-proteobacteria)]